MFFNNKRICNIEHTQMKNINVVNDECMSRQQRSLIAQLRLGILPIHIETGRLRGTQLDDRI